MKLFTSLINTIKEHFRLKLIICFILCAILPLLILGTISYKISYNIAKDKILKETAISCEKNQHLLENRMTQIENLEDSIHFNLCMLCTTAEQPSQIISTNFLRFGIILLQQLILLIFIM